MAIELAQAYVQIVPSMQGVGNAISKAFGNSSSQVGKNQGALAGKGFAGGLSAMGLIIGAASAITQKAMSVIGDSIGSAVNRADQMSNFPKIMRNLGYSSDDAAASIKTMSNRLDGLPTTLSSMTGMVQLIAPVSKSLKDATNISLAFNDALLAGGKSTQVQANAIEQYSQMLAAGKVDMQAWRSIQNAMPGQLNQVAKALLGTGANANDLYNAMKKGKISFDDFNNAIVKLDGQGLNGFASFSQQAKDATAGIGTAMENARNRVAKAIQTIIEAFGGENIAGVINNFTAQFGKIGTAIAAVVKLVVHGDFTSDFARIFHVDEDSTIVDSLLRIRDIFKNLISQISGIAVNWSKLIPPSTVENGVKAIADIFDWLSKNSGGVTTAFVAVASAIATYKTVTTAAAAAQALLNAAMNLNPIGLVIAGIAALVAGLTWFFTQTETGRKIISSIANFFVSTWNTIKSTAVNIWNSIAGFFTGLWNGISSTVTGAWNSIGSFLSSAWNAISTTWQTVWNSILAFVNPIFQAISNTVMTAVNGIISFFQSAWNLVAPIFQDIADIVTTIIQTAVTVWGLIFQRIWLTIQSVLSWIQTTWTTVWTAICNFVTPIWTAISTTVSNAINAVRNVITAVVSAIQAWWNSIWSAISAFVMPIWNAIRSVVTSAINTVRNTITTVLNTIRSVWNSVWSAISNFIMPIWNGIRNTVQSGINAVGNTVRTIKDVIGRCFTGAATWLVDAGKNVITGLINGIKGAFDWLKKTITDLCHNLVNFAKKLLGIASPSRVMAKEVGHFLPLGIGKGFSDAMPALRASMMRDMQGLSKDVNAGWQAHPIMSMDPTYMMSPSYLGGETTTGGSLGDKIDLLIDRVDAFNKSMPAYISNFTPTLSQRDFNRLAREAI